MDDYKENRIDGVDAQDGQTARVYLGLGGNTGARALAIDEAVRHIAARVGPVVATSFLYETAPQLVTDQPPFLNAVVLVESRIVDPHALMRALQGIEASMGRAPLGERLRYGPRPIDLDILCYDDGVTTVDSVDLVVPHALLRTRSFVLRPLADIRPDLLVPAGAADAVSVTVDQLWKALAAEAGDEPLPKRVLPLGAHRVIDLDAVARQRTPLLMAIVNATPDSFSGDGIQAIADGSADVLSPATLVERAISLGADVVDVGGYSTRPGHADVSVEEETRRVMRVVSSVSGMLSGNGTSDDSRGGDAHAGRGGVTSSGAVLLSIDTFRPEVAQACVEALAPSCDRRGAVAWINDVMGMRCDPLAMVDVLRRHDGVGIVIMHSGGALDSLVRDAKTAGDLLAAPPTDDDDGVADIVDAVARDLLATAAWAEARGIARWRLVLDPGIGFGKSLADNVALAGGAARLAAAAGGYPVLIGASRKSFLGKAVAAAADNRACDAGRGRAATDTNSDLSNETREHASHAVTAIAAWEGAHVVRVHDVVGSRAVLDVVAALANGPAAV